MRCFLLTVALAGICLPAMSQTNQLYASPADVTAAIARAKAAKALEAEVIVAASPFHVAVEYRSGPTPASLHEKNNEIINVLEGSGTMIVGGRLKDEKRRDDANLNGSGIDGGASYALVKGSYMFIPAGTPHYFAAVGNDGLTITTTYVPKP